MMTPEEWQATPEPWRALVAELRGRPLDGTSGIRDVDASCDAFEPIAERRQTEGGGNCETDGHYLCEECVHISREALRRRRDLCEECGAELVAHERCPSCDPVEAGS